MIRDITPNNVGEGSFIFTCPEDPEGDSLAIALQISDQPDFSNLIVDTDTLTSEDGWFVFTGTNWDKLSKISGTGVIPDGYQGNRVSYVLPPKVKRGFYARVQFSDDGGTNWGSWSGDKVI